MLKFSINIILLLFAVIGDCKHHHHHHSRNNDLMDNALRLLIRNRIENLSNDLNLKDDPQDTDMINNGLLRQLLYYSFLNDKRREKKSGNILQDHTIIFPNDQDLVKYSDLEKEENILLQLQDNEKFPLFIQEILEHCTNHSEDLNQAIQKNDCHFERLIEFAKKAQHIEISLQTLAFLWLELKDKNFSYENEQILINTVKSEVIQQKSANKDQKQRAFKIIYSICAKSLRKVINQPDSGSISSTNITHCESEDSNKITHELIDELFSTMNATNILKMIQNEKLLPNKIDSFVYVYRWLKEHNNQTALLEIANFIWDLPEDKRNELSKELVDIPKSLKTLYFTPNTICFKNVQYPEYMYVGAEYYDDERRKALTWLPGDKDETGLWFVQKPKTTDSSDIFVFKSSKYPLEYLFVAQFNFDSLYHYVFTWVPGGSADDDKQGQFRLELHGDAVAMRSLYFDHYICTTANVFKTYKRNVLSANKGSAALPSCQWILEDCS